MQQQRILNTIEQTTNSIDLVTMEIGKDYANYCRVETAELKNRIDSNIKYREILGIQNHWFKNCYLNNYNKRY